MFHFLVCPERFLDLKTLSLILDVDIGLVCTGRGAEAREHFRLHFPRAQLAVSDESIIGMYLLFLTFPTYIKGPYAEMPITRYAIHKSPPPAQTQATIRGIGLLENNPVT